MHKKRWLFFLPCLNRITISFNVCAPARISWHEAKNLMLHFLASHRITRRRRSHLMESSSQTIANDRRTIVGNDSSWPKLPKLRMLFSLARFMIELEYTRDSRVSRQECTIRHVTWIAVALWQINDRTIILHGDLLNYFILR